MELMSLLSHQPVTTSLRSVFMETDTAITPKVHLERLRAELAGQEWTAELRGTDDRPALHVANPAESRMNDLIVCREGTFCWVWGPPIGPVTDVPQATARIMYVLREVTP